MYFPFCAGPPVDLLCSQEQHRIKDNIMVDIYDGGLLIPNNYLLKQKMLL